LMRGPLGTAWVRGDVSTALTADPSCVEGPFRLGAAFGGNLLTLSLSSRWRRGHAPNRLFYPVGDPVRRMPAAGSLSSQETTASARLGRAPGERDTTTAGFVRQGRAKRGGKLHWEERARVRR
jgi:hypothetical protein